ncbi:MAG: TonB-dependent receptor [Bacteroidota bacterium]|nr:TonB-dependent receptor [Bacteroidota bacterium]
MISAGFSFAGTTGKLAGRITDKNSGQALTSANIIIESASPALAASSGPDGYYHILNIPPGTYQVSISYIGFQTTNQIIAIKIDQTTTLDVQLDSADHMTPEVIVLAEHNLLQRDQSSTVQCIDKEDLAIMPVNSISEVLQLQSGVVNSSGQIHIRGGRAGEIAYFIDGFRIEEPLFNQYEAELNNQSISQMEFLSGTFNAEYGNALSGIVNIVTKDNTDNYHMNLSYKRTKLGIERSGDDINVNYIEGTFSGPILKDGSLGFLVSGKNVSSDSYYYSGLIQKTQNGSQSIEFSKSKPFGFNDQFSSVLKISWMPFASSKLTLLDNYSKDRWRDYEHLMRFIPDSTYINKTENNLLGLNFSSAASDNFFYDIRFSFYSYNFLRSINGLKSSEYRFPTFSTFSNSLFYSSLALTAYEEQKTKSYSFKGDISWQFDRFNLLRAGAEVRSNDLHYYYINNPANPIDQSFSIYNKKPVEAAAYLQDKLEFETIVVNLGLRFDFYDAMTSYLKDPFDPNSFTNTKSKTSLSPRIAVAYPVRENMVFHFSYGKFIQRPEYQLLYDNLERIFSNRGITLFGSPALEPQKTSSYELGLMTLPMKNTTLQFTFFNKKIENLIGVAWNYITHPYAYYVNEDFASVKGFEASLKTKLNDLSFAANYTLQYAKGSSSSQQERFNNVYNIEGVQSLRLLPLDFDERHKLNFQIAYSFSNGEGPFDFLPSLFENSSFNIIGRYESGLPYTFNPERAVYVAEKNNARLPEKISFDLYARKSFYAGPIQLGVFVDIRNLLNRKNILYVYSATGSPEDTGEKTKKATKDYMQDPANYDSPRTIYLGVDMGF